MHKKKIVFIAALLFSLASLANSDAATIERDDRMDAPMDYSIDSLYAIDYRWSSHSGSDSWVAFTSDAIVDYGLINAKAPADVTQFCPKYQSLSLEQKKMFWIYLVSSVVQLESGFNTQATYKENFNDSSGKKVVSSGLLQLSFESANDYGCGLKKPADLFNAEENLNCGVKIINHWVDEDGVIAGHSGSHYLGVSRYWGAMRTKSATVKTWTKSIPFCK